MGEIKFGNDVKVGMSVVNLLARRPDSGKTKGAPATCIRGKVCMEGRLNFW